MQNEVQPAAPPANDDIVPPLPSPQRIQELLFDAARLGRVDVIPALLHAGANISGYDQKGYTALILASYGGQAEATELLLHHGASVDQPDEIRGNTALMGVSFKGYTEIAKMLLGAGADPHAKNRAEQTALMMAAMFGHSAIVDLLLAAGAQPSTCDVAGNTAISVARQQHNDIMVARLTDRGGGV
ncbi:ankyrin repeat domain-containing protein [Sphingobium sufflavum]|uniref:ankyrin repeat domain-containing protein n=1 Tax=Sphingobium sufflavum TaxID=1129547 RepID=UPI001F42F54D|nr:ankyrin repeat domain-containing protein [Sphingobium sufflavum]MCE7798728.1 ankyrin repeat domain-containing protein [Sphingobium sufflavum]